MLLRTRRMASKGVFRGAIEPLKPIVLVAMVAAWESPTLTTTDSALAQPRSHCALGRGGRGSTGARKTAEAGGQVRRIQCTRQRGSTQLHSRTWTTQLNGFSELPNQRRKIQWREDYGWKGLRVGGYIGMQMRHVREAMSDLRVRLKLIARRRGVSKVEILTMQHGH